MTSGLCVRYIEMQTVPGVPKSVPHGLTCGNVQFGTEWDTLLSHSGQNRRSEAVSHCPPYGGWDVGQSQPHPGGVAL